MDNNDGGQWEEYRLYAHRAVDMMVDYLKDIAEEPCWRPIPEEIKGSFTEPVPMQASSMDKVLDEFVRNILPYNKGNVHPRFWAWVQGSGLFSGVIGDFLASAMNPNNTIGEHSAMYVEKQVLSWCTSIMGFDPEMSSGILLSGASMANVTALIIARQSMVNVRQTLGLPGDNVSWTLYCSTETHSCVMKAARAIGIQNHLVKKVNVNSNGQIEIEQLHYMLQSDIRAGYVPFAIVGNVGTVNEGAIDDIVGLHQLSKKFNVWLHLDGAFGAWSILDDRYFFLKQQLPLADSLAFDFHKWMYQPYACACLLVKDKKKHREAFFVPAEYLLEHEEGLASGPESMNNYGLELSRSFKALKVWISVKTHGLQWFTSHISMNIDQALYLKKRIDESSKLKIMNNVAMNIVCFQYQCENPINNNIVNKNICMALQTKGIASPSSTIRHGEYVLRVAITNHKSTFIDFDILVDACIELGNEYERSMS